MTEHLRRILAHRVLYRGKIYRLAIADISGEEIVIERFTGETASTPFVDGTVVVAAIGSRWPDVVWPSKASDAYFITLPELID